MWGVKAEDMTERQNMMLTMFHNKLIEIENKKTENIIKAVIPVRE